MKDNEIVDKIILKTREKIAVSEFIKEDIEVKKVYKLPKIVATIIATIGIMSGLVYATANIYEKIWKEPKEYRIDQGVTEEEKQKCIKKEEAQRIVEAYLEKIGFNEQQIIRAELEKDTILNDNVWLIKTKSVSIKIDAITGKIKYIYIPSTEYKKTENYGITREEARIKAKELLEKYRPNEMSGEYELVSLKRNSEYDKNAYIWYADFYKKYDNLLNENEHINIGWVPTVDGLYSLDIQNDKYENNEEKITKEEAIKIATEKDSLITKNRKIKSTKAQIRIEKMNEQVYLRENFTEEYEKGTLNYEKTSENGWQIKKDAIFYETEGRVRKVWVVVIEYEKQEKGKSPLFTYYIDTTTGEIIGGTTGDTLRTENTIRNDPHNVIEK